MYGVGSPGTTVYANPGDITKAAATAYPTPAPNLTIFISGRATNFVLSSFRISDAVGQRAKMSFEVLDTTGTKHYEIGEKVFCVSEFFVYLFGGTIEEIEEEEERTGNDSTYVNHIRINCVDFAQLADRFVVATIYTGKTLKQIVDDIVLVQTPLGAQHGISTTQVPAVSVPFTEVRFDYDTAAEAFKLLAEALGYQWEIDPLGHLLFYDGTTFNSPYTVGDSNRKYRKGLYKRDRSNYRNRQIFKGGTTGTDSHTEYIRGKFTVGGNVGERDRTFNVKDPFNAVPSLVTRNGVPQRVGIDGVDKDGDLTIPNYAQWFVKIGENRITQNSAQDEVLNPSLKENDTLAVTYVGQIPLVLDSQNDDEIARRAAIEGGSGEYDAVEDDDSINGQDNAVYAMNRLLEIYGRIPNRFTFETELHGLLPGMLMNNVTLAAHGVFTSQFICDSISISAFQATGGPYLRYRVTLLDGEHQQGWVEYWKKLFFSGRSFNIKENAVISVVRNKKETLTFTDTFDDNVNGSATLDTYDKDPYNWAIFGQVTISGTGENVPSFVIGRSRFGQPYGS